ncbi:MAG: flagellar hook-basal body protein [Bacteriovoracaceae bacterium]|nr:flagellar hook-basal body protein [Bacteriovoracaceae bacterium]
MKNIWVPLSGAIAQQRNVETLANNVANANTPGFKKDKMVFKEYLTALEKGVHDVDLPRGEWKPEDFYRSHGAEDSFVKIDGSYTIHEQGQLIPTGNPLDLAVNGVGFFEILSPGGARYSRKGLFAVSNDGTLVTASGYPVLSKIDWTQANPDVDGVNRKIKVPEGVVNVNRQGEVRVNDRLIASLSVVEFGDIHALKKEGNSLFINPDLDNIKKDLPESTVHQGFIEESNVNAVAEMSSLIKAHRHFESVQRVLKMYDNIAGKAVNEIAKF